MFFLLQVYTPPPQSFLLHVTIVYHKYVYWGTWMYVHIYIYPAPSMMSPMLAVLPPTSPNIAATLSVLSFHSPYKTTTTATRKHTNVHSCLCLQVRWMLSLYYNYMAVSCMDDGQYSIKLLLLLLLLLQKYSTNTHKYTCKNCIVYLFLLLQQVVVLVFCFVFISLSPLPPPTTILLSAVVLYLILVLIVKCTSRNKNSNERRTANEGGRVNNVGRGSDKTALHITNKQQYKQNAFQLSQLSIYIHI